jgi:hypothetical protein
MQSEPNILFSFPSFPSFSKTTQILVLFYIYHTYDCENISATRSSILQSHIYLCMHAYVLIQFRFIVIKIKIETLLGKIILCFFISGVNFRYCGHYWPIVLAPDNRWWLLWRNWWNDGKPATNRLSYGAACIILCL